MLKRKEEDQGSVIENSQVLLLAYTGRLKRILKQIIIIKLLHFIQIKLFEKKEI